jgi:hypothetical protein
MMKKIGLFLAVAYLISSLHAQEQWRIEGTSQSTFSIVDIKNKEDAKEGTHFTENIWLRSQGPWRSGKAGIELKGRWTNDSNIDSRIAKLQSLKTYYKDKIWYLQAGDTAASFNSFVYGGSLKGIKAIYSSPKKYRSFDYTLISGVRKSLWRELFKSVEGEKADKFIAAAEASYKHARAKTIRFSAAIAKDKSDSGDLNVTQAYQKGVAFGVESRWRFNRYITLRSKAAYASGDRDTGDANGTQKATALYFKLLTKPTKKIRSNFTYERASSNFYSVVGHAKADNERITNLTRWRLSHRADIAFSLKASRDNLDGSKGAERKNLYESLLYTYKPKFLKKSELLFRIDRAKSFGRDESVQRDGGEIGITYRGQKDWLLGSSYLINKTYTGDAITQKTDTMRFKVGYKKRLNKERYARIALTLDHRDISQSSSDQKNFGFKVDAAMRFNKRLESSLAYSSKQSDKESTNDTATDTYRFSTTYKTGKTLQDSLKLTLEKRDYCVDESSSSNYNERIARLTYTVRF